MKTSLTPWPTTTRPPFPSRTVEIPGKVPSVRAMRCKPGAGLGEDTVWSAPTRTVQRSAQSAPWNSSHGGRWRSVPHDIRMRPSEFRGSLFFLSPPTAVRESYKFDVAVHFSIRHGLSHTFGPLLGLFLRPQCPIVARIQIALVPDVSPPFSKCAGSTLYLPLFSWALRRQKVSR
jgi:hypothetical protein